MILRRSSCVFQSTLPARGATLPTQTECGGGQFQSTLPARGATGTQKTRNQREIFQSTLPARGATSRKIGGHNMSTIFQSTLPARGATFQRPLNRIQTCLFQSTLPARGATIFTPPISTPKLNFNPRSPHGERRGMAYFAIDALAISIHAPRTGSDDFLVIFRVACCISIHAPRMGSDAVEQRTNLGAGYFNPRSPHGERRGSER